MSLPKKIERLFVTEKPDAARNLVAGIRLALGVTVVNEKSAGRDGYFELSNGDVVAPQLGHLVEIDWLEERYRKAGMDEYFSFLPMVFQERPRLPKMEIKKDGTKTGRPLSYYEVLKKLIPRAKVLVNAGDIDREGQLIFDEIVEHFGIDPATGRDESGRTRPVLRLALVSKIDKVIAQQVLELSESNGSPKWLNKRFAALARTWCDALLGLNASFAWQAVTGWRKMSVGRVQTPVVGLVVQRELDIQNFKPVNYYVPVITLQDGTQMRWHAREGAENTPGFDANGRIISREIGEAIVRQIATGQKGRVSQAEVKSISKAQPLPYDKASLASAVAKRYGHKIEDVSKAMQAVYERHKAITYIGTDCKFLPTNMLEEGVKTLHALAKTFPSIQGANTKIVSPAWKDVDDEHFGIIPTGVALPSSATELERQVFDSVVRRFAAQFYPEYEYDSWRLGATFGGDEFRATKKETKVLGWTAIEDDALVGAEQGESDGEADKDDERRRSAESVKKG